MLLFFLFKDLFLLERDRGRELWGKTGRERILSRSPPPSMELDVGLDLRILRCQPTTPPSYP